MLLLVLLPDAAAGCQPWLPSNLLRVRLFTFKLPTRHARLPLAPLQTQFLHEEKICLPLGAVIGAITGACIEQSACAASSAACLSTSSPIAGIMNERWRPAPGGGGGGRPAESDSDVGGVGGGGRSIFGFGDERSSAGSSGGGRSGAGGAFGEERAAAPRGDGFGGASSSVFRDNDTGPVPGDGGALHGGARRLVGGGAAADADDFDPFKQKLARE